MSNAFIAIEKIMDLPDITSIKFDEATRTLVSDLMETAQKVNDFRPISPEVLKSVQTKLLGERIYNTNAIEGNPLSLRETISILEAGATLEPRRKRAAQEVLGMRNAIQKVQALVDSSAAWRTIDELMCVHEILFKEIDADIAGRLRYEDVIVRGAKHQPPDHSQVRPLLDEFFQILSHADDTEPIHLATWVHWAITRVHPFKDGNGRMARLWQDLVLFQNKLTAGIIRQEDRREYYPALTAADDGDFNLLAQLIAQRVSATLQVYLSEQQAADALKGWAANVVGESEARAAERRRLEYLRWKHQMELVRDGFERCAGQITNASAGILEIQVYPYPIIEQSTWETLRSGIGAKQTWFFKLNCRRTMRVIRYIFFFARHFWQPVDKQLGIVGANVCLLISELDRDDEKYAQRLDEISDTPIDLRELLIVDTRVVRKRWDASQNQLVYDDGIDPILIAQEFLQQVILSRMP